MHLFLVLSNCLPVLLVDSRRATYLISSAYFLLPLIILLKSLYSGKVARLSNYILILSTQRLLYFLLRASYRTRLGVVLTSITLQYLEKAKRSLLLGFSLFPRLRFYFITASRYYVSYSLLRSVVSLIRKLALLLLY